MIKEGEDKRPDINWNQERLHAYIDAMKRCRWFTLIATTLSCLMLLHIYLEQFSFQQAQLIGYLTKTEERKAKIEDLRKNYGQIDDATKSTLAELEYITKRTEKTLDVNILRDRLIPLLGYQIPTNDYLPVIAAMALVFLTGVWLNLRSIWGAVQELCADRGDPKELTRIKRLIRLHFTFTGLISGERAATLIQNSALSLPTFAIGMSGAIDIYSIYGILIGSASGYAGPLDAIILRTVLMVTLFVLSLLATQASIQTGSRLDKFILSETTQLGQSGK